MKDTKYDLIVVGGGVLGTFHAYHALNQKLRVALIEKNHRPIDATVRNFGQVVPSGMNTKWQRYGRESLEIYASIQKQFDISVRQQGTVYLASNQAELALLEELNEINQSNDYQSHLLTKSNCISKFPGLNSKYCRGGLWFPQELNIDPSVMIHRLHQFMVEELQLDYHNNIAVTNIAESNGEVLLYSEGRCEFKATSVVVCNGSDFRTLFRDHYQNSGLQVVKLQMMATAPQKNYTLSGSILTGSSIRRYEAFQECPSYPSVKAAENSDSLEKKYGVHILFKQSSDGSVIIGDSHEYAPVSQEDKLGFDLNMDIDDLILNSAKEIFDLPNYRIQRRWQGRYSQCINSDIFQLRPSDHVNIVTGIGGKGMTASAGFARENLKNLLN